MITMLTRKAPNLGYQVRIPADMGEDKFKEVLTWCRRRKIILDKAQSIPLGYMRGIDPVSWDHYFIIFIKEISDKHRMLLKLTFCG